MADTTRQVKSDAATVLANVAVDEAGGADWQYTKMAFGASGTQTRVSTSNPLPVDLRTDNLIGNIDVNIAASAVTQAVSGTVTANAGTGTFTVNGPVLGNIETNTNDLPNVIGTDGTPGPSSAISIAGTDVGGTLQEIFVDTDGHIQVDVLSGSMSATQSGTWNIGTLTTVTTVSTVTNLAQLGGQAIAMGSGVRTAGTQRVTIATDDLVPVSGTLTGVTTVSTVTNLSQLGGQAIAMGTGVRTAGTQRVTIATDDLVPVTGTLTGVTTVSTVSAVTNLAQLGGQAIAMNTGTRSAGTQRVTVATDDVVQIVGNAAHDAPITGNPVRIAGSAVSSEPNNVAAGDVARLITDLVGKLIVLPFAPNELTVQGTTTHASTTADQALLASGGVGVRNYLTTLVLANSSATNTIAEIKDGTTVIARVPLPANGGATMHFNPPLKGTGNNAINVATLNSIATGYASGTGYRGR